MVQALEPTVIPQGNELMFARALQGVYQVLGFGEIFVKQRTQERPTRNAQSVFQHGVGKQHGTLAVHHGHQRGQQVK